MEFVYIIVAAVVGGGLGFLLRRYLGTTALAGAELEAEKLLKDAHREAETTLKEARIEAKEELHRVRAEVDGEVRERRAELSKAEQRITQREEQTEARSAEIDRRERSLTDREANNVRIGEELKAAQDEQTAMIEKIAVRMIAGMISGILIDQAIRHWPAPSRRAASYSSCGIDSSAE